ncbi:MAG TPA: 6-carboxytetrahydropterin synthase [Noviherbaspirillum sp.]|jgi:6-pyruvoyltetrahydropterin/6-carboxytetrahydropterin synthase|uniref:6-pyruvoyl trahydropterin synthase family protein n=1 Tax=Noviherbaspirillum sp. TaxID=1926288 RepID=UPI002DDD8203|nr:6-carboxytetrahydropterin synthase [Noviherbaspirillum sp.]HEV2612499.1 6-carboxytetrahydropterin synthase [Noviherbaspirillum sp.]
MFELSQDFTFDAAHTLTRAVPLAEFTPSKRVHGHTYTATVTVAGTKGAAGMLEFFTLPKNKRQTVDLFYLRKAIESVRSKLDHHFLDEVADLGAPTLENLCVFICDQIKKDMPVSAVTVRRIGSGDACTYRVKP